ncbi:hypothetical protein IAG25_32860 [Caballeronia sp. EK]|uniref:hypothetical protein n=1 Tax=Caballeronia sp. EK TaxID=2767469 RepID=UPI0016559B84|nr:hypothetical protein [Caballeronia sp. EK]MBC8641617.1 hypothetical protein [Caballeronia sp. EK]
MTIIDGFIGVSCLAVGLVTRDIVPVFFRKKAENYATKQDIAEITRLQRQAAHRFDELLENSKQRHSLRTLVAEKRVEAHQQAFLRVKRLLGARQDEEIINECRDWADANCLYLTAGARKAMWSAIGGAEIRAQHLNEAEKAGDPQYVRVYHEEAGKAWGDIMKALDPIVTDVELPPLGRDELETFSKGTKTDEG